jgi:hypothetical protein
MKLVEGFPLPKSISMDVKLKSLVQTEAYHRDDTAV